MVAPPVAGRAAGAAPAAVPVRVLARGAEATTTGRAAPASGTGTAVAAVMTRPPSTRTGDTTDEEKSSDSKRGCFDSHPTGRQ